MLQSTHFPSLVIAVGFGGLCLVTHLGLRRIADRLDALELRASPAGALSAGPQPAGSSLPVARTLDPALLERDAQLRLRDHAQDQLSRQQPIYFERCWPKRSETLPGKAPLMPARFDVTLTFDAAGEETRRGVVLAFPNHSALSDCVQRQSLPKLKIPPPSKEVTTTVSLAIP